MALLRRRANAVVASSSSSPFSLGLTPFLRNALTAAAEEEEEEEEEEATGEAGGDRGGWSVFPSFGAGRFEKYHISSKPGSPGSPFCLFGLRASSERVARGVIYRTNSVSSHHSALHSPVRSAERLSCGAAPPLCSFSIHYSQRALCCSLQQIKIAVGAEVVTAEQQKRLPRLSSRGRVLRRLRREESGDFDDYGYENDDG